MKKFLAMAAVALMAATSIQAQSVVPYCPNGLSIDNTYNPDEAAGLTFASKKEDYSKGSAENQSESKVGFNFQASALGIEAGSETIRAFFELGVGEQGVLLGGIRAKF